MAKKTHNVIGPQVSQRRTALGLSQENLAARCSIVGWDLSRGTLAKIEARVRCVNEAELYVLAMVLKCTIADLYPTEAKVLKSLGAG